METSSDSPEERPLTASGDRGGPARHVRTKARQARATERTVRLDGGSNIDDVAAHSSTLTALAASGELVVFNRMVVPVDRTQEPRCKEVAMRVSAR